MDLNRVDKIDTSASTHVNAADILRLWEDLAPAYRLSLLTHQEDDDSIVYAVAALDQDQAAWVTIAKSSSALECMRLGLKATESALPLQVAHLRIDDDDDVDADDDGVDLRESIQDLFDTITSSASDAGLETFCSYSPLQKMISDSIDNLIQSVVNEKMADDAARRVMKILKALPGMIWP